MSALPIEPPPSVYRMPDPRAAPPSAPLAIGGDLEPGTVLSAYRRGIFPWPDPEGRLLWWSPNPRAVLPLDGFHESRSLRRLRRSGRVTTTADAAFGEVIEACADRPEGTWITPGVIDAYVTLHQMGWAHSIEAWRGTRLVGGVYGIAVGGLFAAESMFHRERDGSKVALATLVDHLRERGFRLLDVQIRTEHLASLGAENLPRDRYLEALERALQTEASFGGEAPTVSTPP